MFGAEPTDFGSGERKVGAQVGRGERRLAGQPRLSRSSAHHAREPARDTAACGLIADTDALASVQCAGEGTQALGVVVG